MVLFLQALCILSINSISSKGLKISFYKQQSLILLILVIFTSFEIGILKVCWTSTAYLMIFTVKYLGNILIHAYYIVTQRKQKIGVLTFKRLNQMSSFSYDKIIQIFQTKAEDKKHPQMLIKIPIEKFLNFSPTMRSIPQRKNKTFN